MATEVATLLFRADTSDIANADKVVRALEAQTKSAQKSAVGLSTGIDKAGLAASKVSKELAAMERQTRRAEAATTLSRDELKLYDLALGGATKEELALASAMLRREAVAKSSAAAMAAAAATTTRAMQATASATRTVAASTTQAANSAVQSHSLINGAMRNSRHAASQLGYQISDVAVQLEMGTSALRVFGQQGSQIAAAFGPAGIIVGAFIAVGSALANTFIPSLMDGKGAAEDLAEAMEELETVLKSEMGGTVQILTEEFIELAKYQRQAAEVELFSKQIAAAEALRLAQTALLDQTSALKSGTLSYLFATGGGLDAIVEDTGLTGDQVMMLRDKFKELESGGVYAAKNLQISLKELLETESRLTEEGRSTLIGIYQSGQQMVAAGANADALNLSLDELLNKTDDYTGSLDRNRDAIASTNRARDEQLRQQERINQQASAIALSLESEQVQIKAAYQEQRQIVLENTQITGDAKLEVLRRLQEAEIVEIEAHNQKIIDADAKKTETMNKAWADAQAWVAERKRETEQKEVDAKAVTTAQLLEFDNVLLRGKSESAQAGYRMAISLMDAEKREAAKKIISDSYAAAMSAYKALAGIPIIGPALGAAAAAGIITSGVSYAAKSLSGRALGGQVRGGESYIVGEKGPEVLTMGSNGKVTPNDKLRSSPASAGDRNVNVSFNISANDAKGFGQLLNASRGQIIGMINQAMNDSGRAGIA